MVYMCPEIIDSICQFMKNQLAQKAAEWTLFLPANTFTELEKLRSVTALLLLWFFGINCSCLFGIVWLCLSLLLLLVITCIACVFILKIRKKIQNPDSCCDWNQTDRQTGGGNCYVLDMWNVLMKVIWSNTVHDGGRWKELPGGP